MFIDIANFGVFQERFKKFDKNILVKISSVIAPFFPEQEETIKNIMFIRLKKDCLILIIFYIHFKQILTIKAEINTTGRSFFFFFLPDFQQLYDHMYVQPINKPINDARFVPIYFRIFSTQFWER
jgi:hypothetical protein